MSWKIFFKRAADGGTLVEGGSLLLLIALLLSFVGCETLQETVQVRPDTGGLPPPTADALLVVDCLLPGQIKKLGRSLIYAGPRRPIKTPAQDCEIRGGEYVAYDRSDYAAALKVWLPPAQAGDQAAQTYVGEIYEKGLGVQPDYALAVEWYRRAAQQGYARAQINLGHLYEKGLGVERDPMTALHWYRQASGLHEAITIDPASINTKAREELEELRREVERRQRETQSLRQQLLQRQQQLEQARRELQQRSGQAEAERLQLQKARHDIDQMKKQAEARDHTELKRLEEKLARGEVDLEGQRQEIAQLYQRIAQLEGDAEQHRKQLSKLKEQEVVLAGPTIELIDPPLISRGDTLKVRARAGIERVIVGKVTAPAGLMAFSVNERETKTDDKGLFRVQMLVQRVGVPVTIVAIDKQGERAAVEFLLTPEDQVSDVPAPPVPPAPPIEFGNYYALVIGNKNYISWPRLDTPENDAMKIAELLGRKYGFQTKVLLNATRYDTLRVLNDYRKQLTEKDNFLIYYAGHGQLEEKIGRGYWVPVDGEIDSNANWISTLALTDILGVMAAKHVLVVADTCYAGALTRSALARLEAGMSADARRNWLKIINEKRSRTVLTSGDLKPVLDSGGGGHSIFAKAFLDILRDNEEVLEGQRLYQQISARVAYAASAVMTSEGPVEQVPQYAPIKYAGHESGDFLFVPAGGRRLSHSAGADLARR